MLFLIFESTRIFYSISNCLGNSNHVQRRTPLLLSIIVYRVQFGTLKIQSPLKHRKPLEVQLSSEDTLKFVQATLNALSSHISILDHTGKIVAVNRAWNTFAKSNGFVGKGYGLGMNYLRVCQSAEGEYSEEANEVVLGIQQVMEKEVERVEIEYPCHSPTEKRWFIVKISCFELNDKTWIVISHDNITERKLAEQEVLIRDHAIQSISEGITITDPHKPDNPIVYANSGFEKITGYSFEEVLGRNCRFLQGEQTDSTTLAKLRHAIKHKQACVVELQNYRKNGELFWNRLSINPVHNEQGELGHFVGIQSDITLQKENQVALQKSRAELQELNANKDKLFSIISHDLKSPFHSLMGFSEIFSSDLKLYSHEDLQEFGTHVYTATKSLYSLLENLLQWSQIQTGKMEFNPMVLDTSVVLNEVIGLLQGNAMQKNIELVPELTPYGWILADMVMVQLIFQNLISNSLKFTESGGKVNVKSNIDEKMVNLLVIDNGIGISSEHVKNLFKVGEQVTTLGTAQEKGTGLGLILCKELLDKNGGTISVTSQLGKGTEFLVKFPLAQP